MIYGIGIPKITCCVYMYIQYAFDFFFQNPSQVSVALQVFYNLGQLPATLLSIIGGFREAIQHDIQNALDPNTLIQGVEGILLIYMCIVGIHVSGPSFHVESTDFTCESECIPCPSIIQ